MKYLQRRLVLIAASATFAAVYSALRQWPFAFNAAVCASYTVLVLGNVLRRSGMKMLTGEEAKPIAEVLLVHAMFLAVLISILQLSAHLTPFLPDWLNRPAGTPRPGEPGITGFRTVQTIATVVLGWLELRYLTSKNPTPEKGEPSEKRKIIWGKAALEEERMSRLRLR